ncbi:SurA N-terminal domain-containing protein [Amylibacter sp.]|nr:SurA N-terminal domain-containing protein [Amylibacter sp.]
MQYFKIIITLLFFLFPFSILSQSTDSIEIAVEVNDLVITNFEIIQRENMLKVFGAKNITKDEVINTLINERLYYSSATKLDVIPNHEEINNGLNNFAKKGNLNTKELLKYLASRNIYKITLEAYIAAGLTQRKVIQKKFVNNIFISKSDVNSAIDSDKLLSNNISNQIRYIVLSFKDNKNNKKHLKKLNSIKSRIDNCLDLQSESNKHIDIDFKIYSDNKINLKNDILRELNKLDINESIILKRTNNVNYLLMLCTRNLGIDDNTLETLRNKIFNDRIKKIGNAYLQELKGEAFIVIK